MAKRKTTKQSNPRYLISRDGVEVGYYPGFTSVEAIKRAKMHYGAGKYTAEKVDAHMYIGRGAERTQARERRERQEAHHAERMEMAKRRNGTHIHAEVIDHLDVAKVHNPSKYTDLYLDENSRRGKGMGLTPGTFLNYTLKGKAKQYSDSYLRALVRDLKTRPDVVADQSQRGGVAYYRIMENPRFDDREDGDDSEASFNRLRFKFIFIPVPGDRASAIYPIETDEETYEAQEAMRNVALNTARVMEYDHGEIIPTSLTLWQD